MAVKITDATYLTGQLLIAMPAMADPNFHRTVTYICEHSEHGALGLIINRPLDIDLGEVFQQLSMTAHDPELASRPILRGGPVQMDRGFVIHGSEHTWETTANIADSIQVTTSQDILTAMAAGDGPTQAMVALGYAGWGAGQLEYEITENAWLSAPATRQILFDTPFEDRWADAAALLGIDLATLSTDAGHA
ncbi:MAG: YqgE/AlgH family protein [Gammaproteobacteria bacterium]|nr:MAG: YqgE/AlgH family protein [Gammaproteobacteria bacterium]